LQGEASIQFCLDLQWWGKTKKPSEYASMKAWILAAGAFAAYGLVLWSHSLRHRFGLAFFYALLSCLIAISCWVTDAGVSLQLWGITFLIGSTVFYTSLLLGVFVVYVFDGPRAARVAILTVVGVQVLVGVISLVMNLLLRLSSTVPQTMMPIPSLRVNLASVLTNLADMLFLAVCWEYLHGKLSAIPLAAKVFLTLLGVMCLDVFLFNTGAFLGRSDYVSIMSGTLLSRLFITVFAAPILWAYLSWQNRLTGVYIPHRPLFAVIQELCELKGELQTAHDEIQRRKTAEAALRSAQQRLVTEATMDELTGVLNRRGFMEKFEDFSGRAKEEHRIYSVLFMDVDQFKPINDLHGHPTGDLVLQTVANATKSLIREDDLIGRIGGDEFAVVLSRADCSEAAIVSRRILDNVLSSCRMTSCGPLSVTASIGFAQFDPLNPASASELLEAADKALLAAKRQGGNLALCS
jgi:diguanylate cyclase (GGDEF)-like protein